MKRLAVLISLLALSSLALASPALAAPAPSNDTFGGATVIGSLPFSDTVDTTKATTDADDAEANASCGAPATDASVWYQLTPDTDESIVVDASGSSYPAGVIVVTGSPGSFSFVACGFFFGGGAPQPKATGGPFVFSVSAGQTYSIVAFDPQFDSGGNGGTLNITVDVAPPPPVVTLTVDPAGHFNKSGSATVTGTVLCTGIADPGFIDVQLSQHVGRVATVSGFGETQFTCDGTTQVWSAEVFPFSGLFKGGKATSDSFASACGPFQCGGDEVTRSISLRS